MSTFHALNEFISDTPYSWWKTHIYTVSTDQEWPYAYFEVCVMLNKNERECQRGSIESYMIKATSSK